MPDTQIANPAGLYGQTAQPNPRVITLLNNSAGVRTAGDVVVVDVTGTNANTTTTVNDKTVVGVVASRVPSDSTNTQPTGLSATYAVGSSMNVIVQGPARINVGTNTPAALDLLTTSATAGVANTNAGAPAANAVVGSIIAVALEATKDANNTVRGYVNKM